MSESKKASRFDGLLKAKAKSESPTAPSIKEGTPPEQSKSSNPDYVRTTVYLPKTLHRRLKAAAIEEDRDMSDIMAFLLTSWLEGRSKG